jgi:hypothetical protein
MSEDLESRLAAWRESMQTAGIGPGPVRDELESHLRDAFSTRVQSGQDPAAAFTGALERLGPGRDIQQEFNTALGPRGRIKRLLGRRVELFPCEMRLCAWAAIPSSLWLAYTSIQTSNLAEILTHWDRIGRAEIFIFLFVLLVAAIPLSIAWTGLSAAVRYIRQPGVGAGQQLAAYWSITLLFAGYFGLMFVQALADGRYIVRNGHFELQPAVLSTGASAALGLTACIGYIIWFKRIEEKSQTNDV